MPSEAITTDDIREAFAPGDAPSAVPLDRLEFFAAHIHPHVGGRHINWSFDRHEYLHAIVVDDAPQISTHHPSDLDHRLEPAAGDPTQKALPVPLGHAAVSIRP